MQSMSTLRAELASLLACPVCGGHVRPPIMQCQNGHLICSLCRPRVSSCPTCGVAWEPEGEARNLAMEKVAQAVKSREMIRSQFRGRGRGRGRPATAEEPRTRITFHETSQAKFLKQLAQIAWTQYWVDFTPDTEASAKVAMMRRQGPVIGGHAFDGSILYMPNRHESLTLRAEIDGESYDIRVSRIKDIVPGNRNFNLLLDLAVRKCNALIKPRLDRRDFFDEFAKVDVKGCLLQIFPGCKAIIQQCFNSVSMVAEIAPNIREDTVWNLLNDTQINSRENYKMAFELKIKGQMVLSICHNKIYKINDVNWELTPLSSFSIKGIKYTYVDYYREKYRIVIKDLTQPILVCPVVTLVPELCRIPETSIKMDWIRAINNYARVPPDDRVSRLLQFNRQLCSNRPVASRERRWALVVPRKLASKAESFLRLYGCIELTVQQLPDESITTYLSNIESVISTVNPQFLVCVLTSKLNSMIDAIKMKCTVDRKVNFQIIIDKVN